MFNAMLVAQSGVSTVILLNEYDIQMYTNVCKCTQMYSIHCIHICIQLYTNELCLNFGAK